MKTNSSHRKEIDVTHSVESGLLAEQVAEVEPNLVACDKDGQIETVLYTAVNARLSRGCTGRTIWIADAKRDDGKRFIVRADTKLDLIQWRSTLSGYGIILDISN